MSDREELSDKMAKSIDFHLFEFMDKRGLDINDIILNCHSVQKIGKPNDIQYYYKDEKIFRIYLEVCENIMAWKVVPNYA